MEVYDPQMYMKLSPAFIYFLQKHLQKFTGFLECVNVTFEFNEAQKTYAAIFLEQQ